MAEVFFYHLTRTPLEVSLPELVDKSLERGWKVQITGTDPTSIATLDDRLWTHSDDSFLPHGVVGGEQDEKQPVILGITADTINGAEVLMLIGGADVPNDKLEQYQRVCIFFDGNDPEALNNARGQWTQVVDLGVAAKYWSQESGAWRQMAAKNQPEGG